MKFITFNPIRFDFYLNKMLLLSVHLLNKRRKEIADIVKSFCNFPYKNTINYKIPIVIFTSP